MRRTVQKPQAVSIRNDKPHGPMSIPRATLEAEAALAEDATCRGRNFSGYGAQQRVREALGAEHERRSGNGARRRQGAQDVQTELSPHSRAGLAPAVWGMKFRTALDLHLVFTERMRRRDGVTRVRWWSTDNACGSRAQNPLLPSGGNVRTVSGISASISGSVFAGKTVLPSRRPADGAQTGGRLVEPFPEVRCQFLAQAHELRKKIVRPNHRGHSGV